MLTELMRGLSTAAAWRRNERLMVMDWTTTCGDGAPTSNGPKDDIPCRARWRSLYDCGHPCAIAGPEEEAEARG